MRHPIYARVTHASVLRTRCAGYVHASAFWLAMLACVIVAIGVVMRCVYALRSTVPDGGWNKGVVSSRGKSIHYAYFKPFVTPPAEGYPVILYLNGWGENGEDGLKQISNNLGSDIWRMRAYFPFVVICPQCTYNGSWMPGDSNEVRAVDVLARVLDEVPANRSRICVAGASTGGTGAIALAAAHPDRFCSALAISSDMTCNLDAIARSGVQISAWFNSGDSPALVESARTYWGQLSKAGCCPVFTECAASGHNAWDAAFSSPHLYRWMLTAPKREPSCSPPSYHTPLELLASRPLSDSTGWTGVGDELQCTGDRAVHLHTGLAERHGCVLFSCECHLAKKLDELPLACLFGTSDVYVLLDEGCLDRSAGMDVRAHEALVTSGLHEGWNSVVLRRGSEGLEVWLNGCRFTTLASRKVAAPVTIVGLPSKAGHPTRIRYVCVGRDE